MNIKISNVAIRQNDNQFFNLNDLHKASGAEKKHQPAFWLRSEQTKELIAEIEAEGKIAFTTSQGGKNRGTFVCKELVYAYATWISAKFFLLVIRTFDAAVSGSLQPQPKALPNGLTTEQQNEVKKFHRQLVQAVPKEQQAALAITLWSSVKSKFGVGYKQVPTEQYTEVLSLMARVAVEKSNALHGEVLDKALSKQGNAKEYDPEKLHNLIAKVAVALHDYANTLKLFQYSPFADEGVCKFLLGNLNNHYHGLVDLATQWDLKTETGRPLFERNRVNYYNDSATIFG